MEHRAEIDGLRAVAVIPVILFHAGFELFSGGFVGVDVFFVISGYLITTIIISEMANGNFSIANFYERRARRILPALFFVMACCFPFALMWLTPNDLKDFGQSLVAVSTFSSNVLFWWESGYFDTASELKPLLHTWSLAVEEQYYIVFPLFLVATWRLGVKWILVLLSAVFFLSLGLAQWGAYHFPSAAFFLFPTRSWELLVGSFIAIYLKFKSHLKSHSINQCLSLLGFGMILYAVFTLDKTTPYPSFYALIPTIGTGILIVCSVPKTISHRVLSLRPIVGVGLISYSAYLWHQPLFALSRHRSLGEVSESFLIILCMTTLVIAWFSWRFVERPFRVKQGYSRKKVLICSLIGITAFTSTGVFLHLKDGFRYAKNELTYHNLTKIGMVNYDLNNKNLRNDSWRILRQIHNDAEYGVENNLVDSSNNFSKTSTSKRVLLVGNSHSKDLFNVFFNSADAAEYFSIARFGTQLRNVGEEFYSSDAYVAAQAIVLVSHYNEKDIIALRDIVKRVIYDKKIIFIVEEIFNFPSYGSFTLADYLVMNSQWRDTTRDLQGAIHMINEKYTQFFVENTSSKEFHFMNEKFKAQRLVIEREFPQAVFLKRNDYVCPNNHCYGVTPDGQKTFYDYGHHTLAGARFFGQNLSGTKFYRDMLVGIEP